MSAFCPDGCPDGEAGPCVVGHPCALHSPVSAHDTPEVGSGETVGERVRCDTCGHADGLHVNCKAQPVNLLAFPDPVQPADANEGLMTEPERCAIRLCWGTGEAIPQIERILATREAAWAEKYAAVVGERDGLERLAADQTTKYVAAAARYATERARAESAEAALATALREKAEDRALVEAVEALADRWQDNAAANERAGQFPWAMWQNRANELRAALAIPTATADE